MNISLTLCAQSYCKYVPLQQDKQNKQTNKQQLTGHKLNPLSFDNYKKESYYLISYLSCSIIVRFCNMYAHKVLTIAGSQRWLISKSNQKRLLFQWVTMLISETYFQQACQSIISKLKFSIFRIYFFILFVNKYLLKTYNMPDIVLYITRIPVKEINLKNKAK